MATKNSLNEQIHIIFGKQEVIENFKECVLTEFCLNCNYRWDPKEVRPEFKVYCIYQNYQNKECPKYLEKPFIREEVDLLD
jgi:hypothetical protein